MDLWLYTTATPNNYVNKVLSNDTKLTFYTKNQNTDIMNPSIILNGDVAGFCGFNYAYIPEYGRYYFVSPPIISGKTVYLKMHVDVLYTYRAIIMKSPCIAIRSSNRGNLYFQDDYIQFEEGYRYNVSKFPYRFDAESGTYILCISGR